VNPESGRLGRRKYVLAVGRPGFSVGITFAILAAGVVWSLWKSRGDAPVALDTTAKVSD
jgi:hypothetical protein